MEVYEPEPVSISVQNSKKDSELGFQSAPSSPTAADQGPVPTDLNHKEVENDPLHGELQNKLVLKDEDEKEETEKKDSIFDDGKEGISEGVAEESGKGEDSVVDNRNGDDNWIVNDNENDGWTVNDNENDGWKVDGNESDGWKVNENENDDWKENVIENEDEKVSGCFDGVLGDELEKKDEASSGRTYQYPVRPEAEDCSYYLKTGTCKFGSNCKFNHPVKRKNQAKEKAWKMEESTEIPAQTECKYYLRSGGCKYGQSCRYSHTIGNSSAAPILELNFLGLPMRSGEKECPYYMRTGSCKYGANCKFNHPDPTAVGGCDPPSGYANGTSVSLQGVSQSSLAPWSSTGTLNETAPFVPMMLSPTQGVSTQSPEWNGYQPPVYLPERSMHAPSSYVMNNPAIETNVYMHRPQQIQVEEFPERPGEPECSYFLKTGDCKFRSNCKFHHPKNRISRPPPCTLSDKGLPLRPDQNVCTHYSRYGICKFGPACKFDHPIHPTSTTMSGLNHQSSYTNSAEGAGMAGSGNDATTQQSV
ncbi:Zinc finger CCCH domain-containing protein [Quillaja saponaria]|uniref:Zinc finger CCCH domain-containing protein n=1 Tax=Quillaja saponaria TaxID=32244 RepID=A0AAD7KVD4_QUISA|nr:Zinc finger CCCH domain-containing protein [Quillaja saponaria]